MSWFCLPGPAAWWRSLVGLQVALKSGRDGRVGVRVAGVADGAGGQLAEDGTLTRLVAATST